MSDDRVLADILRRFITADREFTEVQFGSEFVIDGTVTLSPNEAATIKRMIEEADGDGDGGTT